jgi:hypothetical protein
MSKKAVFAVGRFQPPTVGHALMIQEVMNYGGDAFIFVSSVVTPRDQNPLTASQKIAALKKMFPSGVTFVDTAECKPRCAGPVAANDYLRSLGYDDITLIAGSDRAAIFGPDGPMWKAGIANGVPPPKFKGLERTTGVGATAMSGTKARKLAMDGDEAGFAAAVRVGAIDDAGIRELYDAIRKGKKRGLEAGRKSKRTRHSTRRSSVGRRTRRRGAKGRYAHA